MTTQEFVAAIRAAQKSGLAFVNATLAAPFKGCKNVVIRNLDGHINGNPHDLWIESASGKKTIGRAYLGSKRKYTEPRLDGWPERIESIA